MLLKDTLREIVLQKKELQDQKTIKRELLKEIDSNTSHVIILSGIRRCGKSTLMKQLMKMAPWPYYFNFEDQRAYGFSVADFEKLDAVFHEELGESDRYFFDEIQNVEGWERYVRTLQDRGKKVIITGSNASLLSKELGTKLTGRHLRYELFPFSYAEMLKFTLKTPSQSSFEEYFTTGGFPEYLKQRRLEILQEFFEDIVIRDIVVRYGLREARTIKELALFLITNSGKYFSYNKLKEYFKLGSTNTVISYLSYFEDSYLFYTVPKFEYSYKKQLVNPKKIYSVDIGLSAAVSTTFSSDRGRMLENLVFLHLRRRYKEIFYFKGKGECDFIIKEKGKVTFAIQVCYQLTDDNKEREVTALQEAMEQVNLKEGLILTYSQEDKLGNIHIKPVWKWLLGRD